MKNGIKLTRSEKILLTKNGYDNKLYLRIKKLTGYTEFINIKTKEVIKITN